MARANLAMEADSAATKDLQSRVEIVQNDQRMLEVGLLYLKSPPLSPLEKAKILKIPQKPHQKG